MGCAVAMLYQLIYTTGFDPQCGVQGVSSGAVGEWSEGSGKKRAEKRLTARLRKAMRLSCFFSTLLDSFLITLLETWYAEVESSIDCDAGIRLSPDSALVSPLQRD